MLKSSSSQRMASGGGEDSVIFKGLAIESLTPVPMSIWASQIGFSFSGEGVQK